MKMIFIFIIRAGMEQEFFKQFIKNQGFRQSSRRDRIVQTFLSVKGHASAEELLAQVRKFDPRVGLTTVYRTLKLMTQAGLALERKFGGPVSTFEPARPGGHHDHLICRQCGRIIEFENRAIEELQEDVARHYRFKVGSHILELYGVCARCAKGGKGRLRKK